MAYKPRFGSKRRDELYSRECLAAHKAERGSHPICVHCDLPVMPGQAWDESHIGTPKALGGKSTGVGHLVCNRLDGAKSVTPMVAKVKRIRLRNLGVTGPGLGPHSLPGGRRSRISKSVSGAVKPRLTHAQKHAAFMARRYPFLQEQS